MVDFRSGASMIEPSQPPNSSAASGEPIARPPSPSTGPGAREGAKENVYPGSADPAVAAIAGGYHSTPFDILGMHPLAVAGTPAIVIRTFQPQAFAVSVIRGDRLYPMHRVHPDGLFEAIFPGETEFFRYRFSITLPGPAGAPGRSYEVEDPYRFPAVLTEFDLHLFGEGTHYRLYEKLGARLIEHDGTRGVCFAVWAPNAVRVSVIGEFNQWDGRRHPMRSRGTSGLWEIFIPGLQQGELYRYEIKTRYKGYIAIKSDPFGLLSEMRPNTASIVWDLDRYQWRDREWMAARKGRQSLDAPIAIYEVHLGTWKRTLDPIGMRWLS